MISREKHPMKAHAQKRKTKDGIKVKKIPVCEKRFDYYKIHLTNVRCGNILCLAAYIFTRATGENLFLCKFQYRDVNLCVYT